MATVDSKIGDMGEGVPVSLNYEQLIAEARSTDIAAEVQAGSPEVRAKARDSFLYNADDIFATVHRVLVEDDPYKPRRSLQDAYAEATKAYIIDADPEFPELKMQAEIILGAPVAHAAQSRLQDIKSRLQTAREGREALGDQERALTHQLIAYNHLIRDFILAYPDTFTQHDLTNWLSKASRNNHVWSHALVLGIAAEVAVIRMLEQKSETQNVRPATVAEDSRGVDVVWAGAGGKELNIDVKCGGNQPLDGVKKLGNSVQIGVESSTIHDFRIKPEFTPELWGRIAKCVG